MTIVRNGFSQRSDGAFKGTIGDSDGWLVRIRRHSYWMDGLTSPVPFYSKKG